MTNKLNLYLNAFLKESNNTLPFGLGEIIDRHSQYLDIYAVFHSNRSIIQLMTLRAKKDAPKGVGTSFMNEFVSWADKNKIIIVLQTANGGDGKDDNKYKVTSSAKRLHSFYGSFGFKSNYGKRSYRPDLYGNMHRNPQ